MQPSSGSKSQHQPRWGGDTMHALRSIVQPYPRAVDIQRSRRVGSSPTRGLVPCTSRLLLRLAGPYTLQKHVCAHICHLLSCPRWRSGLRCWCWFCSSMFLSYLLFARAYLPFAKLGGTHDISARTRSLPSRSPVHVNFGIANAPSQTTHVQTARLTRPKLGLDMSNVFDGSSEGLKAEAMRTAQRMANAEKQSKTRAHMRPSSASGPLSPPRVRHSLTLQNFDLDAPSTPSDDHVSGFDFSAPEVVLPTKPARRESPLSRALSREDLSRWASEGRHGGGPQMWVKTRKGIRNPLDRVKRELSNENRGVVSRPRTGFL